MKFYRIYGKTPVYKEHYKEKTIRTKIIKLYKEQKEQRIKTVEKARIKLKNDKYQKYKKIPSSLNNCMPECISICIIFPKFKVLTKQDINQ